MATKDVVCGMTVYPGDNELVYRGVSYSFCSKQCRERFKANPHLYIGLPGQRAPKQEGVSVIKQRRLRLTSPLSSSHARELNEALRTMMGVQDVSIEGESVVITYDLLQATEKQIEEELAKIGLQLGEGWTERLRRAFVHYEEEVEMGSLEVHENRNIHRHPT
jgi:YHS domain-containing protein/copper chaperone CopZ